MRITPWAMTGAVLAAMCMPLFLRAQEPATRPAPAERRGNPDAPAGRRMAPPPGQFIEQLRRVAKDLDLTDEQKTKIQAALTAAADEFKQVRDELESMEGRERRQRVEEILGTMRKAVNDTLSEEQRQTLRKKMKELRPAAARRPGVEGRVPTTRPGPFIERLQQTLARLGLSDDQKKRIEAIISDAKGQMEEVREGLLSGDEAAREKVGELMMDVRRQIGEILTEDQRERFRDMMAPPPSAAPPPGQRGRRPAGPGGASSGEMMDDARMDGERRDESMQPRQQMRPRQGQRPSRDERRRRSPATAPAPGSGAKVGAPAPDFELVRLDGKPVRLSSFQGRVGVIIFGSYSCPSFRQRATELEALAKRFGSRASFLIVYTKEAHPAGDWDVDRNTDAGIAVEAHQDAAARAAQAEKTPEALKLSIPMAPDTMDDSVSAAFGGFPNGAVVLSRDGVIFARQQWVDPHGLERRIEQALRIPASKPAP
ncbi:MAG TPA: deiodinase-like protein [Tepidisphaeraceae bacterium]|nr:deiodinase-like protein [Tepidisphaeraceae bacterium]